MPKRTLSELTNTAEPAWPLLQKWIEEARNPVDVIQAVKSEGEMALLFLQVTVRSPMGAIALETGGIFIDHGWIRILGASSERIKQGILAWNERDESFFTPLEDALIVAHDIVGGFFAINGGAFTGKLGDVFYWAPDTLIWENLELSYTNFVAWILQGDLSTFYKSARWSNWEVDIDAMHGDEGLSIYPPLWATGLSMEERSRRVVSMSELWRFQWDIAAKVKDLPSGAFIRLVFNGTPLDLQKS